MSETDTTKKLIQERRRAAAQRREQEAANLNEWAVVSKHVDFAGDPDPAFLVQDVEGTDGRAALENRAALFIEKYIDIFSAVDVKKPTPESADPKVKRMYCAVEAFLKVSTFDQDNTFQPGPKSLLVNVTTLEQAQAITAAYASEVYWRTVGLKRNVREAMQQDGSWAEARFPESDLSRTVLPFWNGLDGYYGETGGLPVAPYERSSSTNGWRLYATATETDDCMVDLTLYLFGPGPQPRQSLSGLKATPSWRPTLMAVRHVTSEVQTFQSFFTEGLSALRTLSELDGNSMVSPTWAADQDARQKASEQAAYQAAVGNIDNLQTAPEGYDPDGQQA